MDKQKIKDHLINAGIDTLKEFGYPEVNTENILTDIIYSGFFSIMLEENKGQYNRKVDEVIDELLTEINQNKN